jgi:hypothetical protein
MRKIILLSSIILLSTVLAAAQDDSDPNGESNTNSSRVTIEGCLDGAIGHYTLTVYNGASYKLTGDADQLNLHVREMMRVTGVLTPVVHVPGAVSESDETQPTLSVISLKRVSSVCGDASTLP